MKITEIFFKLGIEEGFIKKPRQTVADAFGGKMAAHMLLIHQRLKLFLLLIFMTPT